MRDIKLITGEPGTVTFEVRGAESDSGLLLLQRLYVILLTDGTGGFRTSGIGSVLSDLMVGGNIPPSGVLDTRLAMACTAALGMLDEQDAALVSSFTGTSDDQGNMELTLVLASGTTIKGVITNG